MFRDRLALVGLLLLVPACATSHVVSSPDPCQAGSVAPDTRDNGESSTLRSLSGSYELKAWWHDDTTSPSASLAHARLVLRQPTVQDSVLAVNAFGNRTIIPVGGTDLLAQLPIASVPSGEWSHDSTLSPVFGGYNDRTGEFGLVLAIGTHWFVTMTVDDVAGDVITGSWDAAWDDVSGSTIRKSGGLCGTRSQ